MTITAGRDMKMTEQSVPRVKFPYGSHLRNVGRISADHKAVLTQLQGCRITTGALSKTTKYAILVNGFYLIIPLPDGQAPNRGFESVELS